MDYSFTKEVTITYEEAVTKVTEELKKEGFGILTEINVKETLRKKLDVDFNKYVILGACNPPFAYKTLQVQEDIGLFLPCNVIVYENKEGKTVVAAINPKTMVSAFSNPELEEVSDQVAEKLKKVIDNV